jgi:hypothetical protein
MPVRAKVCVLPCARGCLLSLSGVCYACEFTANEGPVRIQYKCLVPIYVQYSEK